MLALDADTRGRICGAEISRDVGRRPAGSIEQLSDGARSIGAARVGLLNEIHRLAESVGKKNAVHETVRLAKARQLPEGVQALVAAANARSGERRTLSSGSLYRWMKSDDLAASWDQRIALLAERRPLKKWIPDDDVLEVLAIYRQPNKPALAWCARQIAAKRGIPLGSLDHRSRRALKRLPNAIFYPGRNSGAALKALQCFRRRDFLPLAPNDIWVGDGHGAKLKVAHPITGNPFVPEVTAILDVGTRYCVGWSVALSENCLAVSDALRHGVAGHGIPLIYYSDNGGGQKNQMFDAPVTGTLGALGIQHDTGRPGNPQGRGVIERFWATVLLPLAQQFETYHGPGADRDTLKNVSREIHRTLKAAKRGDIAVLPRKLPSWDRFLQVLAQAIESYNHEHRHSSLPKLDGHYHSTPAQYRENRLVETGVQIERPQADVLATLFMPAVQRRAQRGEVRLWNGIYFHRDLMLVDGEQVQVCYDIHDASRVWIKKLSGEFIACAELNGNRDDFVAKPRIEQLREDRAGRRMDRLQSKVGEVWSELHGDTIPAPAPLPRSVVKGEFRRPLEAPKAAPLSPADEARLETITRELTGAGARRLQVPNDPNVRYAWHAKLAAAAERGASIPAELQDFVTGYGASDECRRVGELFAEFKMDIEEYASDLGLEREGPRRAVA